MILTCAHNMIDQDTDPPPRGHPTAVYFFPRHDSAVPKNPAQNGLRIQGCRYPNAYKTGDDGWDIGVFQLANPVPNPPQRYFSPTVSGEELNHQFVWLAGYPGDKSGQMWEDYDQIYGIHLPSNTMLYTHDTINGDSGAPTWTANAEAKRFELRGVHVSRQGKGSKRGVLITQQVMNWLQGLLDEPVVASDELISIGS